MTNLLHKPIVGRPHRASLGRATLVPRERRAAPARRWSRAMKLVRRVHLYTGLALVPFVVLYGVTAFLFNHATVWSSTTEERISAETLAAHGRRPLGPPDALAAAVVHAVADDTWRLDPSHAPRFRGRTTLSAQAKGIEYSLTCDEPDGPARLVQRPERQRPARTGERGGLDVGRDALDSARSAADAVLAAHGADGAAARLLASPRLEFGVLVGDDPHVATYDPSRGSLALEPAESRPAGALRSFLLRLHTAHGYPAGFGVAFWWALLVDVLAVAMVLWALSGLAMWWQMRALRRAGLVALALCAVATWALVSGMWDVAAR